VWLGIRDVGVYQKIFKHFSEHFCLLLGISDSNLCLPASRQINPFLNMDSSRPLFISGIPITSKLLTVSYNCGRLAKSPSMINHTTAGDERQKWVATTERAEHATTNH
jgi:hypothetical protein